MFVNDKIRITLTKGPIILMLGLLDSEKVEGILNDIFLLVITSTINHLCLKY